VKKNQNQNQPADAAELRRRAEERLKRQKSERGGQKTDVKTARLVHELEVHQIELEMQKEELQSGRAQVETLLTQYTDLYDFAPTGYMSLDHEGTIHQVNLSGARLFDVERSRLMNRRFGLFVTEGDRCVFSDFLKKVFASETKEYCEVTLSQKGHRPLFVRIEGTRSADGQECRAVVLDFTERRQAEEALRESEAKFRILFEQATDGMLLVDVETRRFILTNRQMQKMLGYTDNELHRLTVPDDLHPADDVPRIRDLFERMARNEITMVSNVPLKRKDGTVYFTDISTTQIHFQHRNCLFGIFRDVTERKLAEAALRRNEAQIHAILESTADGILAVDSNGKVVKANRRFAELWRIPQSLMESGDDKALIDFVMDQLSDPDAFLKKVQALYKSDTVDMDTITFKDGRIFERHSSPMIMGEGVIGRVWSFRDVTEQRQLQQRLLQSGKMEAVGQLTAGIAHEFNNLLTSILGYSNLVLARLPSGSSLRRDLEHMETAGNRAAVLTRQLLTFGRKYPQELKSINLNTIVLDMQRMLEPLLGVTIHLTTSLDPALSIVVADPAQIGQIIMNMAVNARDAMPHGGELTIATANVRLDKDLVRRHPEAAPGSYVRLTVADTGVGMSDDVKARLFDPFFTTKAVGQGTGLGLATCIGIIKQTGGFIDVDSVLGKGTTFQVFLPQADADGATQSPDK